MVLSVPHNRLEEEAVLRWNTVLRRRLDSNISTFIVPMAKCSVALLIISATSAKLNGKLAKGISTFIAPIGLC